MAVCAGSEKEKYVKLAITGASGNYGRLATQGLLERCAPEDLVLISRSPAKLADMAARGCQARYGDFDDPESMCAALQGVDRMLMISTGRVGNRVPQHGNAIAAAKTAGVHHIVYTSFVGVGDVDNPALVIRDHDGTEALLRESSLRWTALRDSQYADAMLEAGGPMAIRTGIWRAATGEGRIAFVTREDCAACAVAVMAGAGHEDRIYNVTGPERLRFRDVAAIIANVSGRPVDFQDISFDELYAMFDAIGVPREALDDHNVDGFAWSSDDMVSFERAINGGHFDVISDDVERLLGRAPESFSHFAHRHADALRAIEPEYNA
jgi:NAD(P)H dehydrogenase (quinone)